MTNHTNCEHDRTPAARAACRKARKNLAHIEARIELINVLGAEWVLKAAWRFGSLQTTDVVDAADAILGYFAPSGDEARDRGRRANGYIITTSAREIRSIVLRSFS